VAGTIFSRGSKAQPLPASLKTRGGQWALARRDRPPVFREDATGHLNLDK
jgi:hypothetical protein